MQLLVQGLVEDFARSIRKAELSFPRKRKLLCNVLHCIAATLSRTLHRSRIAFVRQSTVFDTPYKQPRVVGVDRVSVHQFAATLSRTSNSSSIAMPPPSTRSDTQDKQSRVVGVEQESVPVL
jgi:hypothetical protein